MNGRPYWVPSIDAFLANADWKSSSVFDETMSLAG